VRDDQAELATAILVRQTAHLGEVELLHEPIVETVFQLLQRVFGDGGALGGGKVFGREDGVGGHGASFLGDGGWFPEV
jgi:hypothetical protein